MRSVALACLVIGMGVLGCLVAHGDESLSRGQRTAVSVHPNGNVVQIRCVLAAGKRWSRPAVDSTKHVRLRVASGSPQARILDAYLVLLREGPAVTTTTTANDTATIEAYLTGDPDKHPEHDCVHRFESVEVDVLEAGLIRDGRTSSHAVVRGESVHNASDAPWPKVIFRWAFDPDDPRSVMGAHVDAPTLDLWFCALHKYGVDLPASSVVLTDATGGTHAARLSRETLQHDGSVVSVGTRYSMYRARFDLADAADGVFAAEARIKPAFGPQSSEETFVSSRDGKQHFGYLDKSGALVRASAYVETRISLPVEIDVSLQGRAVLVGETSTCRAVVDGSGNLLESPLTICYTAYRAADKNDPKTGGFHVGEKLHEHVIGKSLVNPEFRWIRSRAGQREYFVQTAQGGDAGLGEASITVIREDVEAAKWSVGEAGDLQPRQYQIADMDDLGYRTLYVRLADSRSPAAKWPDYLLVSYATGQTVTVAGPPTGLWSASPALGDPERPFGSQHTAWRAIAAQAHARVGAKSTSGSTVYLKAGLQTLACCDRAIGRRNFDVALGMCRITRDPSTVKDEVVVVPARFRKASGFLDNGDLSRGIRRLRIGGLTIAHLDAEQGGTADATPGHGRRETPEPVLWLHDVWVRSPAKGQFRIASNATFNFGSQVLAETFWHAGGGRGNYTAYINCRYGDSLWGDMDIWGPREGGLFVNVECEGLDASDKLGGNHADVLQTVGPAEQGILYNVRATNCRYQGVFCGGGGQASNIAFVNCVFAMADDGDLGSGPFAVGSPDFGHTLLWNLTTIHKLHARKLGLKGGRNATNWSIRNVVASSTLLGQFCLPVNIHQIETDQGRQDPEFGVRPSTGGVLRRLFGSGAPVNLEQYPTGETWTGATMWRPGLESAIGKLEEKDLNAIADQFGMVLYDIYGDPLLPGNHVGASGVTSDK